MPAAKNPCQKVVELAVAFVDKQKGVWNHEEWEQLVARAASVGVGMDDEAKRNLGNILEALKFFYQLSASSAAPKPAAKKKAASRK